MSDLEQCRVANLGGTEDGDAAGVDVFFVEAAIDSIADREFWGNGLDGRGFLGRTICEWR